MKSINNRTDTEPIVPDARFSSVHLALVSLLLAIALFGMFMILHPLKAYAAGEYQDFNKETGKELEGDYMLTENIDGTGYHISSYAHIKVGTHKFTHSESSGQLFTLSDGARLVIEGEGFNIVGIDGYESAILIEGNNCKVELIHIGMKNQGRNPIQVIGNNNSIKLDHTLIFEFNSLSNEKDGAIWCKGDNLTVAGVMDAYGIKTGQITHCDDDCDKGGAVHVEGNNASISNIKFAYNKTEDEGGAIWVSGDSCTVESCQFENNSAGDKGGYIYIKGAYAKILNCNINNSQLFYILKDGKVIEHLSSHCVEDLYPDGVDPIESFWNEQSSLSISARVGGGVYIEGNSAQIKGLTAAGCGVRDFGGAIYLEGNDFDISDSKISNSVSLLTGGGIMVTGKKGRISGVTTEYCTAKYGVGGIGLEGVDNVIEKSVISKCFTDGDDGGIRVYGNNNTVKKVDIDRCCASDYAGAIGFYNNEYQGNTLIDSTITRCYTKTDAGGAMHLNGKNHVVDSVIFYKNQALTDHGGAICIDAKNVKIDGCEFRGNKSGSQTMTVEYRQGINIKKKKEYTSWNILKDTSSRYSFKDITEQTKDFGQKSMDLYYGGAIFVNEENTVISNSAFTENLGRYGGAIYVDEPSVKINGCTFTENASEVDGGAIYFDSKDSVTDTCTFLRNRAFDEGGAMYYNSSNNILKGSGEKGTVIEGNQADVKNNYGHGVFVDDTDLTIGGKLIVRNNGNIDISKAGSLTEDGIPTWSNLCLYDDTDLTVAQEGIHDSDIWLDSDWGHYKKPAGGYIYKASKSPALKAAGFRSDRSGFHFTEKKDTLYYEEGSEKTVTADLPLPTVSVAPKSGTWTKNPGRVYIELDSPYDSSLITKNYKVTKTINGGAEEAVEIGHDNDRAYVDVTGEKGDTVLYKLTLSYSVELPSPSGGTEAKTSEKLTVSYKIENPILSSRVSVLSAYESFGELVSEYMGKAEEGSDFECRGMRYPIVKEGQIIEGWKLRVDGESKDRDIDADWDEDTNVISFTLPEDLGGKDVLLIPQRAAKKYSVRYEIGNPEAGSLELPEETTIAHGSRLTIKPLGGDTGLRSVGSYVNGEASWGRKEYSVEVTGPVVVTYMLTEKDNATVRFDDERMKSVVGAEKTFIIGQSFTGAGLKTTDSRYQMNEIDHFQVLHQEEKTDGNGNVVMNGDKPVMVDVYNESLTLGVDDPVLGDCTLKPVWVQTVLVAVSARCSIRGYEDALAKEMELEGGSRNGETITAELKTGDKIVISCTAPDNRYLYGWMVNYYTWRSSNSPGVQEGVASDTVTTDGQKIADAVNKDGQATYRFTETGLEFTLGEDMKAVKTDTPLRIQITPLFKAMVTGISGVPEEMNVGDKLDLSSVTITPAGAAKASDIRWTVRDAKEEREVTGTYSPSVSGPVTLRARITDGRGPGKDYEQSFRIEAGTVKLTFYEDMAGTKEGETFRVEAGESLAEYAQTLPAAIPEDYSFAGWTTTPKKEGSYSYKETIGDASILFDFTGVMPAQQLALYPVFIRDRLKVELDLGDGGSEYTPAEFGIRPDGEEQSGVFYAEINEALQTEALNSATRPGYKLEGWYTSGGVKITDNWPITPKHCDVDEDGKAIIDRINNFNFYTVRLTAMWTPVEVKVGFYDTADGPAAGAQLYNATASLGQVLKLAPEPEGAAGGADGAIEPAAESVAGGAAGTATEETTGPTTEGTAEPEEEGAAELSVKGAAETEHKLEIKGTAEGREFVCWTDSAGVKHAAGEEILFDDSMWPLLAEDGTLHFTAEYADAPAEGSATIRFDTDGGSYVAPIIAAPGEDISGLEIAVPERAGYQFAGWTLNGKNFALPDQMPEESIVLTAEWTAKNYTIKFYSKGGTGIQSITAKYGTDIRGMKPADPVKEHFTFAGWIPAYPDKMPAADMALYAEWTPNEYSVIYDANGGVFDDGSGTYQYQGSYDAPASAAPIPEKDGYEFQGWDSAVIIHIPGEDTTINAVWKKDGKDPTPAPTPSPSPTPGKQTTPQKNDTEPAAGSLHTVGAGTYKISSVKNKTVIFVMAKVSAASIKVPASVKISGKTYKVEKIGAKAFKGSKAKKVTIGANVTTIQKNAFKGSKVTTLIIKTKKLKKAKVKGSLKGSKVKTIKVKVGKKKVNKKYVKKYKKVFTKKNAGKKVTVK